MPGWNFPEVVGLFTYPQEVFAFTITRVQLPLLVYQTGSCLWPPSCTLLFFLIPPSASLPWTGPWPSQPGHAHSLGPFHGPRSKPPPPAPPSTLMDLHITEEGPPHHLRRQGGLYAACCPKEGRHPLLRFFCQLSSPQKTCSSFLGPGYPPCSIPRPSLPPWALGLGLPPPPRAPCTCFPGLVPLPGLPRPFSSKAAPLPLFLLPLLGSLLSSFSSMR